MPTPETSPLLDPTLRERVKGLGLVARRVVEGALHGLHRSPFHGLSIEFAQHREYSPGDELKHLDWRVMARSDRYVIKQYEQETNLRAVVFLDCSKSMAFGGRRIPFVLPAIGGKKSADRPVNSPKGADLHEKLYYGKVLAAALSQVLLNQGDSVGLVLTSYKTVAQVPPSATPGQFMNICHTLVRARPRGFTDIGGVLRQFAIRLKRRSLVVVISDLLDDPEHTLSALGQLHHRGHEVVVFQILDPREIDFELGHAARGVTVIRDIESGAEFETEPLLVRDLVRQEINRFFKRLDEGTRAHGVHLQRCSTAEPVERVLTDYLHRRLKGKRR